MKSKTHMKLGELCKVVSGTTPKTGIPEYWGGSAKWITPAELDDDSYIVEDSARKITELGIQKTVLSPFPAGTVLLTSRAPIGKVAIAGCEMYCNQGFKNLVCSEKIHNKFLYWFLKSKTAYLNSLGRGATFKEISKAIVEQIEIELPSVEKQKKVAMVLEKIRHVLHLRRAQLAALDELVKARFVEMFGDPIKNSKRLPLQHMAQRYHLKAGITTPADAIHEFSVGEYEIPCYGGNGIRGYVATNTYEGTYPIIGRQGALCGNVQFATGKFHATEHAVLVTPLREDNLVWTYHLLKMMDLFRFHTGAAQPGLAVKTLNEVDVLIADKALQKQFADFAIRVEAAKAAIQRSLEEAQRLFDSQLQEHFE